MNLKISPKGFRFRVDPAELEALLEGRCVEGQLPLGRAGFSYRVAPAASDADMRVEASDTGICLFVARETLARLRDMGPSKEGVCASSGDVGVHLQVDIRAASKEKRAA